MTAFVLVSDSYTGGWVWREVTARLRATGVEAYPVTLTGMGDRRHLVGPDTDLDTHVEDLVQLIDHVDTPELVLVGHGYGIHPVLGAADRRPGRVARIVYLDAGLPLDGESVLDLMPDQGVRDWLVQRAEQAGDRRIPAPSREEWPFGGSVAGVSDEALERLVRLAAPQPLGTFTQPLRLSGAAAAVPTSGILCTGNGLTIAAVELVAGMGNPRFRGLADPRVGFFELATGHWPMLSCPEELAEVLVRAGEGEGHRIRVADPADRRFLLDPPERPRERRGRIDLHLPDADGPRPAVVFVHGGPVPADAETTPRDSATFLGYARYAASLGLVGVTVDHRLHSLSDYTRSAEDVAAAVELARNDPRVDGERVALWFFSGGGLLTADWLAAPPAWLRCLAATYPVLAPMAGWGLSQSRFRPAAAVSGAGRLPIVLTRVGLESEEFAATVEEFLAAAKDSGTEVEVIDVPLAHHGFETIDRTEDTRRAVEQAMRSVAAHLRG
jgi:pimeloyl-ACP methyl ester carboxylesterase